jgi:transposase
MTKRNTYSKEFQLEAVRLVEQSNKSPNEIAIDLAVRRNQLYKWQTQLKKQGDAAFRGAGRKPPDETDELARLRKELAEVKLGRDILKKAAAYFA